MKKSDEVVVYWTAWIPQVKQHVAMQKNATPLMYEEPTPVFDSLFKSKSDQTVTKTYLQCPAVKNALTSLYVVFNKLTSSGSVEIKEDYVVGALSQPQTNMSHVLMEMPHAPTLSNQLLVQYNMNYCFFAEEPLEMRMTSPWFHHAPHMQLGGLVPGVFDIGKWYRPANLEFNLWSGITELKIEEGEPLAYFEFGTDKKIVFKQYVVTEKLQEYASMCVHARSPKWHSLQARYDLFGKSRMKDYIMKEIRENLL